MINVGIIGRNFGYKVIFSALKKIKDITKKIDFLKKNYSLEKKIRP